MKTKLVILVAFSVAVAGGVLALAATSHSSSPPAPTHAPWVNPDGTVDTTQMPDSFAVVGSDGQPIVCPNGKQLRVSSSQLTALPGPPGLQINPGKHLGRVRAPNGTVGEQLTAPARHWNCGRNGTAVLSP